MTDRDGDGGAKAPSDADPATTVNIGSSGEAAGKPQQPQKANSLEDSDVEIVDADPIEDSDDEAEAPRRPSRAAARHTRTRAAPASEDDEDDAVVSDGEVSEASESEEDEEEYASGSEEEEEEASGSDSDAAPSPPKARRGGRALRPRPEAPPPRRGARRSARAAAAGASYNEDALMAEALASDGEEEEERNGAPVRRLRSSESNDENADPESAAEQRRAQPARAARRVASASAAFDEDSEDEAGSGSDSGSESDSEASSDSENEGSGSRRRGKGRKRGGASAGSDGEEEGEDALAFADNDLGDDVDDSIVLASIEKILASRPIAADAAGTASDVDVEMRVKITGWSYRRTRWIPRSVLLAAGRAQLVRSFEKKAAAGTVDPYGDLVDGVHPDWLEIDRVISSRESSVLGMRYLVKWRGLGYSEATWESAAAVDASDADREAVARFQRVQADGKRRADAAKSGEEPEPKAFDPDAVPSFLNGRALRPYQLESLRWMTRHWAAERNCILGDEMGLGKTAQSIAALAFQREFGGVEGPFLIVAPLTTLGHWQREVETWTDMDCVLYAGSAADRAACRRHDLYVPGSSGAGTDGGRLLRPHVVLTSYDTLLRDSDVLFGKIFWQSVIVDEAHRLKSTGSATRAAVADLEHGWLLLLTGTPVQNNMRELFGLMNMLDAAKYPTEADFLKKFGDERTGMSASQVKALQAALKPVLLRRMKEDVETLPEKEECIIWTQLTLEQRAYYRAIFERRIGTLLAGSSAKNAPNLRNMAMELRKVCCHPFLCEGLEADIAARRAAAGEDGGEVASIVAASGKMLLLHKLLPKLRAEGHKVLIFSQFKIMLDVLEDYCRAAGHPVERIDGSTSGRDRQAAIDRYSKEGSDGFVFLLSTRAGGQGITLTAADTAIIYDSDWNPQNDLQAMARCHRIGQDKDVTIYRLVCKDTYEEHVFKTSSRKYGLDEAILGGIGSNGGGNEEMDGKKIAELLKHGAHCLDDADAATAEGEAFAAEDIDSILKGRTEKRQIGGRAGNTFSVATFAVEGGSTGVGGAEPRGRGRPKGKAGASDEERAFWAALLPEAVAAHDQAEATAAQGHVLLAPRQRKAVDYSDGIRRRKRNSSGDDATDSDYVVETETDGGEGGPAKKRRGRGGGIKDGTKSWTIKDVTTLFDQLLRFGFAENGVRKAAAAAGIAEKGYRAEDVPATAAALRVMLTAARTAAPPKPPRAPRPQDEASRQLHVLIQENKALLSTQPLSKVEERLKPAAEKAAKAVLDELKTRQEEWDKAVAVIAKNLAETATAAAGIALPPSAAHALKDPKLADRMLRSVDTYEAHLREVERLAEWAASGEDAPLVAHVGAGFPHFWGRSDDARLMRGLVDLGWGPARKLAESVEAVLTSAAHGFPEKVFQGTPVAPPDAAAAGVLQPAVGLAEGSGTGLSKIAPPNVEGDSFQVPPSAGASREAAGAAVAVAPLGSRAPRALPPAEWSKFKELLVKHIRSTLLKYLFNTDRAKVAAAVAKKATAGPDGAGPAAPTDAMDSDSSFQTANSDSSGPIDLTRSSSMDTSDGSAGGSAGGSGALKGRALSGSGDLRKQVLHREASKRMEEDVAAAAAAAAGGQEAPMEIDGAGEGGEDQDEDPIERFSQDGDDDVEGQLAAAVAAAAEKTPPSETVPALDVFEETRGGKFTASGGAEKGKGKAKGGKKAPPAAAAGGVAKPKAPAGAAAARKADKSKGQKSLFDMGFKSKAAKAKAEAAAAAAEAEAVDA